MSKEKFYNSIIFIINLETFKVIHILFNQDERANVVILDKYICISSNKSISLYDINDYKLIEEINDEITDITKYNENIILGINDDKKEIIIYNILNLKNITFQKFKVNFLYKNHFIEKLIYRMDDQRIIVTFGFVVFIFELPKKFNFIQLVDISKDK